MILNSIPLGSLGCMTPSPPSLATIHNLNELAVSAAKIWSEVIKGRGLFTGTTDMMEFAAFLGDPWKDERGYIVNINNPEIVERLKKILGPHGRTYLKILEAQNDDT